MRKNRRQFLIYILIGIPILILLIKNWFFNGRNGNVFLLNNPSDYVVETDAKAFVIKDEFLYYIGDTGFEINEEKIGVNVNLGYIENGNIDSNFEKSLDEYITSVENSLKLYEDKKTVKFNYGEFSSSMRNRRTDNVLSILERDKTGVFNQKELEKKLLRYKMIKDTLKDKSITSKNSGLLSTKIDGLEDVYNFNIVDLIEENDFDFTSNENSQSKPGVKIVNNLKYYLCIKFDKDKFKDSKYIRVSVGDTVETGVVKFFKEGSDKDLIIAEFTSNFEHIKDKRILDIKIVNELKNNYKLPIESVTTNDKGESHIYILDSSSKINRIKVEVTHIDEENKFVYINSKDLFLNPFANVIQNPKDLKKVYDNEK